MSVIKATTTEALEMLAASFEEKIIIMTANGGNVRYKCTNDEAKLTSLGDLRTAEVIDVVTAVAEDPTDTFLYTTPNSLLFRIGETIPVLKSGIQVGAVSVIKKDATTITVIRTNKADFTPAISDQLVKREDEYLIDGTSDMIDTRSFRFMKYIATAATDLIVQIAGNGEVRKF